MEPLDSGVPQSAATAYDSFSRAYNMFWGPTSLKWLGWLGILIVPRIPGHARVLDLCCGSGQLSGELSRRGFRVTGLDGSGAMLQLARTNAPGVPLIQGDARAFALRSWFDAVLCVFDSFNHLLSTSDLVMAFRCVYSCLKPGGWLCFDVNTEVGYALHWKGEDELVSDDSLVRTWSQYREQASRCFQGNHRKAWWRCRICL